MADAAAVKLLFSNEPIDEGAAEARERLRRAVGDERVDPALRVKVRNALGAMRRPQRLGWHAGAALTLVLVAGAWTFEQWFEHRQAVCGDEMGRLPANADPLLRDAVGDHLACVLGLRAPSVGIAQRTPTRNRNLAREVAGAIPAAYRKLDVHQCRYETRGMLHFVFERERHAVSVLIASRGSARLALGERMREGQAGRFHLAGRDLPFHVVYLVSENARTNRELLERVTVRLGPRLAALGPHLFSAEANEVQARALKTRASSHGAGSRKFLHADS